MIHVRVDSDAKVCAHVGCTTLAAWQLVNLKDMYRAIGLLACSEHRDGLVEKLSREGWSVGYSRFPWDPTLEAPDAKPSMIRPQIPRPKPSG